MACPLGYQHRWNAEQVLCSDGPCGQNDTDTCCTLGRFFSHSWRVLADSNVTEEWEVRRVRFLLDDGCDLSSEADTAPGIHSSYSNWPNGEAFSHHFGHGTIAARAFAADPVPTPRKPAPVRVVWTSGAPCAEASCFIGFRWESDVTRYPLGNCRNQYRTGCATESNLKKAGFLRIGCAEVEQSDVEGRYATSLRLQFLEASTKVPDLSTWNTTSRTADYARMDLWRTAGVVQGLDGGVARVRILDPNSTAP